MDEDLRKLMYEDKQELAVLKNEIMRLRDDIKNMNEMLQKHHKQMIEWSKEKEVKGRLFDWVFRYGLSAAALIMFVGDIILHFKMRK